MQRGDAAVSLSPSAMQQCPLSSSVASDIVPSVVTVSLCGGYAVCSPPLSLRLTHALMLTLDTHVHERNIPVHHAAHITVPLLVEMVATRSAAHCTSHS